jgi:hypothetical protein
MKKGAARAAPSRCVRILRVGTRLVRLVGTIRGGIALLILLLLVLLTVDGLVALLILFAGSPVLVALGHAHSPQVPLSRINARAAQSAARFVASAAIRPVLIRAAAPSRRAYWASRT